MITPVPLNVKYSMTDKQRDALTLMLESIHKPDAKLRGCAHNQLCYNELMEWRQKVIEMLQHYERQ